MKRKLIVLLLLLLLISVGMVMAQSSANFVVQRHVIGSGGLAASAHYNVTSVIGQQNTDVGNSANFKVSAGFLHPRTQSTVYLPIIVK